VRSVFGKEPTMILSVSRRTDIPNYYSEWFLDRIKEEYHLKAFGEIASRLNGYCTKVVISFVYSYAKIENNMKGIGAIDIHPSEFIEFSAKLAAIAKENGMQIETCAERVDLSSCGIKHGSCIDKKLIEKVIESPINVDKDKNQREECGCIASIDVGAYNTCLNGCKYCYANDKEEHVIANRALYDVHSPILCGKITENDKITERVVQSMKEGQMSLFNLI
jgi:hypothetical protein